MPHADAISFVVTFGLLQIIFRIVSVVLAGVSVVIEGVFVVVSVVTAEVSVVSLMFLSCLKQVYESAMRLQDEHRGLKSLYPSNFDVANKVSTKIYCFSSKFDGLLQKIPIATICFNHLFQFHSLKQISQ